MCLNTIKSRNIVKQYILELLKYNNKTELYRQLKEWEIPAFPVNGNVLMAHGCPKGSATGQVLEKLKEIWLKHDFQLSSDELLNELPGILKDLNFTEMPKRPKLR